MLVYLYMHVREHTMLYVILIFFYAMIHAVHCVHVQ